jgi:XapX domain-containing protein
MKIIAGLILGLLIGAACRWFDVPVPSPPKLVGALLVVAMTIGYMGTDRIIASKFVTKGRVTTQDLCGGPTGTTVADTQARGGAPAQGGQ